MLVSSVSGIWHYLGMKIVNEYTYLLSSDSSMHTPHSAYAGSRLIGGLPNMVCRCYQMPNVYNIIAALFLWRSLCLGYRVTEKSLPWLMLVHSYG